MDFKDAIPLAVLALCICAVPAECGKSPVERRSVEDSSRCRGMECEQWDRISKKVNEAVGRSLGVADYVEDVSRGCLGYTEAQIDRVLQDLREEEWVANLTDKGILGVLKSLGKNFAKMSTLSRVKRKVDTYLTEEDIKWESPVKYAFDGTHDSNETKIIKEAIEHWEQKTCIRFQEIDVFDDASLNESYISFTNISDGCWSLVGRVNDSSQIVNLQSHCFEQIGVPIHEIGHALGFWHEQQRSDRDKYIELKNINLTALGSQHIQMKTKTDIPYDYSSLMQYPQSLSRREPGSNKQAVLNPLLGYDYARSMGQRIGLSFLDTKAINREYCAGVCSNFSTPCERGGYPDPNNCTRCVCPDGFGGDNCQTLAPSSHAVCGGIIELRPGEVREIMTPGYDTVRYYDDFTECSWLIKCQDDDRINLYFDGEFSLKCTQNSICNHWVEVKHTNRMDTPGPRYCCTGTPRSTLNSETTEMVVIMKALVPMAHDGGHRGFKAIVTTEKKSNRPWSKWTYCGQREWRCQCGGRAGSFRWKMCGSKPCKGKLASQQTRNCDRACKPKDLRYSSRHMGWYSCKECYPEFIKIGDVCQRKPTAPPDEA